MYENSDELIKEIAAGEDTYLEFKEVIFRGDQPRFANEESRAPKEIAEVFVSIANTEGGAVVFGINKFGEVVGIDPDKRELLEQWVVNCALNSCEPKGSMEPRLNWRYLPDTNGQDRLVLHVAIPKSQYYVHHTSDGKFLKRVGSHRTPIPAEQLGRLLTSRTLSMPFEERPCPGTVLDHFNRDRFEAYYTRRFGHPFRETGVPLERLLANLKLLLSTDDGSWRITNLGILLFTDRPQNWLGGAYLEIAVYDHDVADGNTRDVRRFDGPLNSQIESALAYLQNTPFLAIRSEKSPLGRRDKPAYSGLAIQEAIVNAVVHRDYELTGSQIIVNLFPDRLEIRNPGFLHNTLKPEDLYAGCQPMRRNQHLAGFFRDFPSPLTGRSLMEARGVGFLSLVRESEILSGRKPTFEVIGQGIKLTIFAGGQDADP
ncbi:MAG: putative DNA binding domain-containing protein [Magnetococcales bacterium]|nr:putative DNA binding domain-containing protein [Magnetococcales bacterium]MBF0115941.1 putative DNA binding domain-containing protein [Magnetococcales bacterium]